MANYSDLINLAIDGITSFTTVSLYTPTQHLDEATPSTHPHKEHPSHMSHLARFSRSILEHPVRYWSVVAIMFVLSRIATWGFPFDSDHWIFYYVGSTWLHGGTLYVDAWDHKPPLIFLFNGLMSLALGDNIILHRIWLTALTLIDTGLFYLLLKRIVPPLMERVRVSLSDDSIIKIGFLLYVFLRNLSQFTSSGNNTENYGLTFVMAMWLSYLAFARAKKWRWLALSGFFCSVLFFLKGNFLIFGAVIGILLLLSNRRHVGRFFLYAVVFVVPMLLHGLFWVLYFVSQGSFSDFVIAVFTFNEKYSSTAWSGALSSSELALIVTTLILLVPAILLFIVCLRDARVQCTNQVYLAVSLSFVLGVLAVVGVGTFAPYYLEIVMPFIVIVMTYGLVRLPEVRARGRRSLAVVVALALVLSYGISLKQLQNTLIGSVREAVDTDQEVADYVKANTTSTDTVFDYDYGATFYVLADRRSGSRFISASHLLLDYRGDYGFDFDDIFISDMERNQTKYVVINEATWSIYCANTPIADYLNSHYELEVSFGTQEVLRRK